MPELVVAYINGSEERYPLAEQDVFIGRDTQLAVSIPDSKISRKHARVFLRRGAWFIEDLGSVNGVVVDGVRITTAVPLSAGKIFYIGDQQLRLEGGKQPKRPALVPQNAAPSSPSGAPTWALEVNSGPLKGQVLTLAQGRSAVLGRDAQADLTVADPSISRKHARLLAQGHELSIEDLGSSNGSYVADEAITRAQLHEGDLLRVGNVTLTVRREGGAKQRPITAPAGAQATRWVVPSPKPKRLVMGLCVMALVAAASVAAWQWIPHPDTAVPSLGKKVSRAVPSTAQNDAGAEPQTARETAQDKPRAVADPAERPQAEAPVQAPAVKTTPAPGHGALARLTRAWGRLVGKGPSPDERARGRRLASLYAKALQQSRGADRDGAITTLKDLLHADPLHHEGRLLMGQMFERDQEADALHRAQGAMQAGQALQALGMVSEALDRPYRIRAGQDAGHKAPPSNEAQELMALGDQAALQLSQACGERAQAACMAEAWGPCIVQLSCLLGYQPKAVQGLALLTLATDAVRPRSGVSAAPDSDKAIAADSPGAEGPSPLALAQNSVAQMQALYAQPALRQAVLVYSTGDIGAASQKLHPLTCPQCRVVGADVRRVAMGLPRAKQLRESGQHEAARALYDDILAADARLLPPPIPSVLHDVATMGKQALLLMQGAQAFERGAYKEALAAYLEGQKMGVHNEGLQDAIARLSRRAQDILAPLEASLGKPTDKVPLSAGICGHLDEVLAMTAESDAVHHRAAAYLSRCKAKS